LSTLKPALVFLGAAAHWEKALQGAVILAAVAASRLQAPGTRDVASIAGSQP
jgi:ribose/xylose/arabinose/galactoside ABC-type transport system permease subunit